MGHCHQGRGYDNPIISEVPDSKLPFYVGPEKLDFVYFAFKMKDGSLFRQYELTKDDRWVKHHWPEVDFENALQFEVWGLYFDQYSEPKQWPIFKLKLKPWMEPVFKYHNEQPVTLVIGEGAQGGKIKRTARYGFGIPELKKIVMWEIDNGYNVESIEVEYNA